MSKSIEDKAADYANQWFKGDQNDHEDFYTCGQHFISGYKADREDVVRVIEAMRKSYAAEIELDMLTPKGIAHNEIRLSVLELVLTHLNLKS